MRKNIKGTANAMEVETEKMLLQMSVEECKMWCIHLLTDGYCKALNSLKKLGGYGNKEIKKEEYIVTKRLSKGLKNTGVKKGTGRKKAGSLIKEMIPCSKIITRCLTENLPDDEKMKQLLI